MIDIPTDLPNKLNIIRIIFLLNILFSKSLSAIILDKITDIQHDKYGMADKSPF